MADGATLPIRVEVPKGGLQLDTQQLDEAFDELAEEEGLTDEEKERLARKASKVRRRRSESTLFARYRPILSLPRPTRFSL